MNDITNKVLDKTLVIVLTHANTDYKISILNECLSGITFPKLLSVNYPLTYETQRLTDWTIYSKENPILLGENFSDYDMTLGRWFINSEGVRIDVPHKFDNAYAVCKLIKDAINHAKYLGKEYIHVVNYDFTITDEVITENTLLLNEHDLIIYTCPPDTFRRPACSTAFFSAKLSTIEPFFNRFNSIVDYYWYKIDGLFLEEKFYTFFTNNSTNMKEDTLHNLGMRCHIGRHAIIADFD